MSVKLIPADTICCDVCDAPIMTVGENEANEREGQTIPGCENMIARPTRSKMRPAKERCPNQQLCGACQSYPLAWSWSARTADKDRSHCLASVETCVCPSCMEIFKPKRWTKRHEERAQAQEKRNLADIRSGKACCTGLYVPDMDKVVY